MINKFKSFTSLTVSTLAIIAAPIIADAVDRPSDGESDTRATIPVSQALMPHKKHLSIDDQPGNSPTSSVRTLAEIPDEETRESISTLIKELMEDNVLIYEFERVDIIQSLANIPDEETRQSVAKLTKALAERDTHERRYANTIQALANIPDEETRQSVAKLTKELTELDIYEHGYQGCFYLIEALANIPDEETRQSVVKLTKELAEYDKDGRSCVNTIKALAAVPDEKTRQSVVKITKEIETPDEDGCSYISTIKVLAKIPDEETQQSVVKLTKELAEYGQYKKISHGTMKALANIQDEGMRESIVNLTKEIATNARFTRRYSGCFSFIQALAKIQDEGTRQSVVKLTKELMTDTMDGQKRLQIIQALASMRDKEQRESFIRAVRTLIFPTMSGHDATQIISQCVNQFNRQPGMDIDTFVEQVRVQAELDRDQYDLNEGEYFARIVQLIHNPESVFSRFSLNVTSQEAISAQRKGFYDAFSELVQQNPSIAALQPSQKDEQRAFEATMNTWRADLDQFMDDNKAALDALEPKREGLRETLSALSSSPTLEQAYDNLHQRRLLLGKKDQLVAKVKQAKDTTAFPALRSSLVHLARTIVSMNKAIQTMIGNNKQLEEKILQTESTYHALNNQAFRLETAVRGLRRLKNQIRKEFIGKEGLPTITSLAVMLDRLTKPLNLETFASAYITEHFQDFQAAFPTLAGHYGDAGQFLQAEKGAVTQLVALLTGDNETLPQSNDQRKAVTFINHFGKAYHALPSSLEARMPMVEALFMSMRGHNTELENPLEKDSPACTDGVYLNFIREIVHASKASNIMAKLAGIDVIACRR